MEYSIRCSGILVSGLANGAWIDNQSITGVSPVLYMGMPEEEAIAVLEVFNHTGEIVR
jgi:hypothetical protein